MGEVVADAKLLIVFEIFDELGDGALVVVEGVGAIKGGGMGEALSAKIKGVSERVGAGLAAVGVVGEILGAGVADAKIGLL
ncbi:MAG: hypothetical protein Ctma_0911 [Catillopecten margaritatus gill symbiont]|uniref:Uncharacterized protein n=1 Tax=Catillopecten margaritatus gill symbiont TaxID=3083288 RepID=A0AAU6PGR0_9GAMM